MAEAIKVGFLVDTAVPGGAPGGPPPLVEHLDRAVEDVRAQGRLDRGVEWVVEEAAGLPEGSARAVEEAFGRLDRAGVLLVVGPAIGDNALVATPLADAAGLAAINWAGTERGRGEWMFQLQVGSHEDEPVLLARYLTEAGAASVGVIHDRSPIGRRYLGFFLAEAERLGLRVTATAGIGPLDADASSQVEVVRATAPGSLAYLGLGHVAAAVARAVAGAGWHPVRVMNSAGLRGGAPEVAQALEGWVYIDMQDDANRTLAAVRERLGMPGRWNLMAAVGHDMGRLVAEGLARAPELTRAGVREGLEAIKWLPAAEGEEGTLLGFGHLERGALHGRYMVLRRWTGGRSVAAGAGG